MEIHLTELPESIRVIFSKRKTVALEATEEGSLLIRAPLHLKPEDIEKIARNKRHWFQKQISRMERNKHALKQAYAEGTTILWLGQPVPITYQDGAQHLHLTNNQFVMPASAKAYAQEHFEVWFRHQAHQMLIPLAENFAKDMKVKYQKIRINTAKTRWGSCSAKGNINFSWRLMMAPLSAIEYVVIHELCHLKELSHSQKFWNLVKKWRPNYGESEAWLSENAWRCTLPK